MSEGNYSAEFICPLYHERLEYFIPYKIFDKEEYEGAKFINLYKLNSRYRDFKILSLRDLPAGFPVDCIKYDYSDTEFYMISIRAMHRICCQDLLGKSIHFMKDQFTKWKILNYDNSHGSLIKFIIHNKEIPFKYRAYISLKNSKPLLELNILHIDSLWNLDNKPGFLIYFYDKTTGKIESLYIDSDNIRDIKLIPFK